jgi:hypothetical protein
MDTNNALNELKDIHLPEQISIFPLAVGWYILIALILVITIVVLWQNSKKRKYKTQIRNIYQILDTIERKDDDEVVSEVSILLKRVAIMQFPDQNPHTLFGEKWLMFLDKTGKTTEFTNGTGKCLSNIYQKQQLDNPKQFFILIKKWLGTVL